LTRPAFPLRRANLFNLIALIVLSAVIMSGKAQAADSAKTERVELSLVVESAPKPGNTIWVAFIQRIRPHWHTYWRNAGESGLPTTIDWTLPPGVEAGAIVWPTPQRIDVGPIVNFGFEGEVALLVPLTLSRDMPVGAKLPVSAQVSWLVCEEICIPEQAQVDLDLNAARPEPDAFVKARAALPKSWPGQVSAQLRGPNIDLILRGPNQPTLHRAYFFPDKEDVVEPGPKPKWKATSSALTISLPRPVQSTVPERLSGVLDLGGAGAFEIADVAISGAGPKPADPDAVVSVVQAALFAFLGGLILNLMPCVLPILSMKALSLTQTGGDRAELRRDGLFYLFGVLACFGAIAGTLLALKAGGAAIGWGFQLQSPPVVLVLALLMVAIGLNLSGLFEVPLSLAGLGQDLTQTGGGRGAFFTGVLAVLVASPCTAPFMGAALGFALTQPAPAAFAVFLALGAGFAAPFTGLAFSPALVGLIPRPGPWMVRFKEFLAFPMFATAIWLIWVLAQQTGPGGVMVALSAALAVAFLCWIVPKLAAPWGQLVAVLGLCLLAFVVWQVEQAPEPSSLTTQDKNGFLPWSLAAVAQGQADGRPVFVDFTAAWCVTCQVNERVALATDEVRAKMIEGNVLLLKADWTRNDPLITAELARFGRAGVPLYLLYPAGGGEPQVLPQILTPGIVATALVDVGRGR